MNIEKLIAMPTHQKVEDGYAYDPKYIGKVYQVEDKIVYFKEKSVVDFPVELFKAVERSILNNVKENYISKDELEEFKKEINDNLSKKINNVKNEFENSLNSVVNSITTVSDNISELITIKDNVVLKDNLNETVDKKLTDVYNNFNKVTDRLVKEAVAEGLKDSKRDTTGKLKMSSLIMLKELGMDATEIKTLAESGLI